ncbi:polysaccharide deacetylase family protein [Halorussus gelatinilyticus]|uniref:Polysaccharide deacetylase family protein n=1 Tax=Halorussus gelatinilyticus TaxID=2937524 RepID=A0A8U0IH63_9EURY|nr:polysaccharide deacetylase family protein [Halorussus gelatinilyticus]UPW00407.1 polysaccharide deacetylase family protein [Halorussus gelatinilyticus]
MPDDGDSATQRDDRDAGTSADPRVAGDPKAVADHEFALLLTHDVDRPYKTIQSAYHAVEHRDPRQLLDLLPGRNPWWQFEEVMELEDSLGVRSAFYFLREKHLLQRSPSDWLDPFYWIEQFGRYEIETPEMLDLLDRLHASGWEVGLHGSYDSYDDRDRLRMEKATLEEALGEPVVGGRQHHLNRGAETWDHHRDIGLRYDASPGSSETTGFDHGYLPRRPFDDEFVVFPLTVMEAALPDPGDDFAAAWAECEALLSEAAENGAVMSALWHPRLFTERDFPGQRRLYRRLVERALEMGAWVGPPRDYYELMEHPEPDGGAAESRERNAKNHHRSDLRRPQAEDNKVKTHPNTESTE